MVRGYDADSEPPFPAPFNRFPDFVLGSSSSALLCWQGAPRQSPEGGLLTRFEIGADDYIPCLCPEFRIVECSEKLGVE
jgi:hypothetical protein